jgi:hypothetical protein
MTVEGLMRLSATVWVNPALITAVTWEPPILGEGVQLRIYHPASLTDYFVVAPECEWDIIKALGIERPAPAAAEEQAAEGPD